MEKNGVFFLLSFFKTLKTEQSFLNGGRSGQDSPELSFHDTDYKLCQGSVRTTAGQYLKKYILRLCLFSVWFDFFWQLKRGNTTGLDFLKKTLKCVETQFLKACFTSVEPQLLLLKMLSYFFLHRLVDWCELEGMFKDYYPCPPTWVGETLSLGQVA